jgi:hypothetical protein
MEKKICSKCKEEKEVCEFYKNTKNPSKYRGQCKKCMNTNSSTYYINNVEKISEKNKKFRTENPEINKEKCKTFREKNPENFKKWLEKNKEHRKDYINNYNLDPKNKLKNSLRSRVNELMNKKYNNPRTLNLVGCNYEFLMSYIESKFTKNMSWDNYGYYGWHLDHIIPLSTEKTEKEIYNLYHYTNLQPLWAEDNLKKSNKILI